MGMRRDGNYQSCAVLKTWRTARRGTVAYQKQMSRRPQLLALHTQTVMHLVYPMVLEEIRPRTTRMTIHIGLHMTARRDAHQAQSARQRQLRLQYKCLRQTSSNTSHDTCLRFSRLWTQKIQMRQACSHLSPHSVGTPSCRSNSGTFSMSQQRPPISVPRDMTPPSLRS